MGEGVPPTYPDIWVGGDPLLKKRREGGRGITPLPPKRFSRAMQVRLRETEFTEIHQITILSSLSLSFSSSR
jgi:hypothetical protein